jgi:hypothetical protein
MLVRVQLDPALRRKADLSGVVHSLHLDDESAVVARRLREELAAVPG